MLSIDIENVTLVTCSLRIISKLCLRLILPKLSDFLLSKGFRNNVWMNSMWGCCIYYVRTSIRLSCLEAVSICSFNHDILSETVWHYSSSPRAYVHWLLLLLLINNVQEIFANGQLFLGDSVLCWSALNVIDKLLKIAIIIHGWTHLDRFGILTMLLILLINVWKHIFNSWVISGLNNHHLGFFDTSMPLVMIF